MLSLDLRPSQQCCLKQRLTLIESFLAPPGKQTTSLNDFFQTNSLILTDLTDPMMSAGDVNCIFKVLLNKYQAVKLDPSVGKIVFFDEAHKYIANHEDPLSATIAEVARQMRHHGIRLAVSTQKPQILPPELLELATVAVIHRFHSRDWFSYLKQKLPLDPEAFDRILDLPTGNALVFSSEWKNASKHSLRPYGHNTYEMRIRDRLTMDGGMTKCSGN